MLTPAPKPPNRREFRDFEYPLASRLLDVRGAGVEAEVVKDIIGPGPDMEHFGGETELRVHACPPEDVGVEGEVLLRNYGSAAFTRRQCREAMKI